MELIRVAPHRLQNFVSLMFRYEIRATAGTVMTKISSDIHVWEPRTAIVVEKNTNRTPARITKRGNHLRLSTVSLPRKMTSKPKNLKLAERLLRGGRPVSFVKYVTAISVADMVRQGWLFEVKIPQPDGRAANW